MAKEPAFSPGTVSKLLWHFTGGPERSQDNVNQPTRLKAEFDAYQALKSILKCRKLNLGEYPEKFKVWVGSEQAEIFSACACCLADIPVQHLGYHAHRYGKFAIGFHRAAAVRHSFNPVFYSPKGKESKVVEAVYNGFSKIEGFNEFVQATSAIWSPLEELSGDIEAGARVWSDDISQANVTRDTLDSAYESLRQFFAFVKTFQDDEFGTIYCEREWRALEEFNFEYEDVAMIVLPRGDGGGFYFNDFVNTVVPELILPRTIPVVPWEDLVEH